MALEDVDEGGRLDRSLGDQRAQGVCGSRLARVCRAPLKITFIERRRMAVWRRMAAGANSIFVGEKLLTTSNPEASEDEQLLDTLGLEWGPREDKPASPAQ